MLQQFTGLRHHPSLWVVVPDVSRSIENIYYIQRNICMYLQILFLEENRLYKIEINKHFTKLKRNHIDLFVGLDLEWTFKLFVVVDIDQRYCWWFKIHKYANWLGVCLAHGFWVTYIYPDKYKYIYALIVLYQLLNKMFKRITCQFGMTRLVSKTSNWFLKSYEEQRPKSTHIPTRN